MAMFNQQAGSASATASKSASLTFSHRWKLNNFSHLYDENCGWKWSVQSEMFSPPGNKELKFSMRITPWERGADGEVYLGVALCTHRIPAIWKGKVTLKERYCIVDTKGRQLYRQKYPSYEVFEDRWTLDDEYLRVERLLDPSNGYLKRGTLIVLNEMTLHSPEAIFTLPANAQTYSSTTILSSVSSLSHSFTLSHFKWLTSESARQMPLCVESEYFAAQRRAIGKIKLEFHPKGRKGDDEEKVEIAIFNANTRSLLVHVELALLDAKGDKCHQLGR